MARHAEGEFPAARHVALGIDVTKRRTVDAGAFAAAGLTLSEGNVETHPAARRQGLVATLVWRAGLAGLARPGVTRLVIVADPGGGVERIYQRLGFTGTEDQLGLQRTPAG